MEELCLRGVEDCLVGSGVAEGEVDVGVCVAGEC